MLGVFVGQLGVLEDVSQDFCHLHWVDFRCMGLGCVLDSPLSWYSSGDVTGQVRLCILENRRRQPESGLSVIFLIVPVAKLKVFLIRYT